MFVVGITGGIGSGKSAVSDSFADLGIKVVDADIASRVIVEPGQPALEKISAHFGPSVIQSDGTLHRRALREQIFSDKKQRDWLELLLHPLIGEYLQRELALAGSAYAILVSPLLIETGQARLTNRILVVDVPESVQIERVMQRDNNTKEQVLAIIEAQTSRGERLKHADDVISNKGSIASLEEQVGCLHTKYVRLAREHAVGKGDKKHE